MSEEQKEAYRSLRARVSTGQNDKKVIAVIACGKNAEKSNISLNLAISLADVGRQVLFIEADQQNPVLAELTEYADRKAGFSGLLSGKSNINDVICSTDIPGLCVLYGGKRLDNMPELVEGEYFGKILNVVKSVYHFVVIDTPAPDQSLEGTSIARRCDEVLLVLESGKVRSEYAQKMKYQIEKCGCKVAGVILNNSSMRR